MNVVNLNFAAKPYEYRLCKYGFRGMAIKIPNFNINSVDLDKLNIFINEWLHDSPSEPIWSACRDLNCIDKLLFINAISSTIETKRIKDYMSFDIYDYCCLNTRLWVKPNIQ